MAWVAVGAVSCRTQPWSSATNLPSTAPVNIPSGAPTGFPQDVAADRVPVADLVPADATITGVWYANPAAGPSILVAYALPGADPLRRAHGLLIWRHTGGAPPWRPVFGVTDAPDSGVVQIQAAIGDATGDASPDTLVFENAGGSGVCGTWRVIDLANNAEVYRRHACDTTIDISRDTPGLVLRQAVYAPGDAHCCPSATRTIALVYVGQSRWKLASSAVTANG